MVISLVAMSCVALIFSSAGDQDIATMEMGAEYDPTAEPSVSPTPEDPTALRTDPTMVDPTMVQSSQQLPMPKHDPTEEKAQLSKMSAKTKVKATKGVDKLARMNKNLEDFRAFLDVASERIEEMEEYGGEEAAIIKPMVTELRKAPLNNLVGGWGKFAQLMQKKNPMPASLAHYMVNFMTKQLETKQGLLTVRGRKVVVTGETVGLEDTPDLWDKFMKASLRRVVNRAKKIRGRRVKKQKKKKFWLSKVEKTRLWGFTCVNNESTGEGYRVSECHLYKTKSECQRRPGCQWDKPWKGN